jgi:AcrR family transcriptional regulator
MARKSAEERREEIVAIAFRHFAEDGYQGTSTEVVAREAGISQPYLFRLFRTKRELFLACVDHCFDQVTRLFERAADGVAREERRHAMGAAYGELLADRSALLLQMQAYTASEPEIRTHVRERFHALRRRVAQLQEIPEEETWSFFADGMLLNVVAMLDVPWLPPE